MKTVLILALMPWSTDVVAQEKASPFVWHWGGSRGYFQGFIDKVFFMDTLSGDTLNELDVMANNPFESLDLPKLRTHEYHGTSVFDVSTPSLRGKIERYISEIDSSKREYMIILGSQASTLRMTSNPDVLAVTYNLFIQDEGWDDYPEARNSSVRLYDVQGGVIAEWDEIGVDADYVHVSGNGQYAVVAYGAEAAHTHVEKSGFRIYDVQTGQLLTDISTNCNYQCGSGNDLFIMSCGYIKYVFNPIVPAVYRREFTFEEERNLLGNSYQGYTVRVNDVPTLFTFIDYFERLW